MPAALTPEQTFGFGSVPLTSYFKAPKGGSRNTQFAPQARAMLQQDEAYQQEQRQMEADQLVNDLLGQASELSDDQINQTLIQNPNIFRGRGAEAIQGYQQFRQQAVTPADQRLGTYFYTKIQEDKDPRALQNFQRRMLDEGMSANDAWEAYRTDQFNEPLMQQLAEAGVPREQFDMYRTQTGAFDPVEVSRGVAQARAAGKVSSRGGKEVQPIDVRIETLKEAMEERKKRLEAVGGNIVDDDRYKKLADELDVVYDEKLVGVRPAVKELEIDSITPKASGSKEAPIPTVVDAPPAFDVSTPPEENQARLEQYNAELETRAQKQKVADSIARAWTGKKIELIDKLEPFYKSPDEMRAVANSILLGKTTTAGGKPEPYIEYLARKLGIKLDDVAFEEPEEGSWNRLGTQAVTNAELLSEWAQSFLDADKKLAAANAEVAPQTATQPTKPANIKSMKPRE